MSCIQRYEDGLHSLPQPGCGYNYHTKILGVANLGARAGLNAERMFSDIRRHTLPGNRRVPDKEIQDTIKKALSDMNGGSFAPRQCAKRTYGMALQKPCPRPPIDGEAALEFYIRRGLISDRVGLLESSPIRISDKPEEDPIQLMSTLYGPDESIWIGTQYEKGTPGLTIRTAGEWESYFRKGGKAGPHVIPNPMSGMEGRTKDGKPSFRCDDTVKKYRFCVVEFDNLLLVDQFKFWSGVPLPVVALIDSGGKSVHAWLDIQKLARVQTFDQWTTQIKTCLYDGYMTPMGVDSSCSNPSRLSRLPGHFRAKNGTYQRLLWLSAEGRPIC